VYFEGKRATGYSPQRLARIGFARTFQQLHLFANMTVVENVMMGRHLHSKSGVLPCALRLPSAQREERRIRDSAMEQLKIVGLEKEAQQAPLSLAYGKQKMLEVARALATEPKLMLMDEPAGGLSTSEIEGLADLIVRIRNEGVTVLLVEHRMMLVRSIADKVVVLNYGNKIADGEPADVMCQECVITAYLGNE
jgi:branched-chain amino acid transport system ATP-binding protein